MVTLATRQAINLLNRDHAALTDDLAGAVGRAVKEALDAQGRQGQRWLQRRQRTTHWLCRLIEEIVEALVELNPTALGSNAVKAGCQRAALSPMATIAVTAAADKLTQIVTTSLNFATGHEQALFLLRLAAMATCPNPDQHPSLERTCANPVISGIATDAAKVQLRSA